ncbi:unnamed protein product [Euphydryas editha]|uniref:Uncharacterized protein n=1 Tax=Euphydryas editha TaxID=104508 RepID=A0AAU9V2W4_EUPED|nr:unnamed protein product [Euphydryas editha]
MGATFEETVLDFDLNFLHHSSNVVNDCKFDKQKKAVLLAKKKTIATDSLIKKYYGKKEQLEQTEILLLAAKEECKQVCIDYKDSLEKCTQLEKDVQLLQNENKDLQSNCCIAQNQVEAIKSHAHQLQVLVKEHETVIEALKIEKQLDKNFVKDNDKTLLNLQKENETLLKDLCLLRDIVLGKKKKRKRYKLVLQKYEKAKSRNTDDSGSESSCEEIDLFDSAPPSPLFKFEAASGNKNEEHELKSNQNEVLVKKVATRLNEDSDSLSNEIVSEDTGRGSSLAFSDVEKCINSPDYFCNDSPFGSDSNKIKVRRVYVDACTSPSTVHAITHIATSPILFDDEALLSDNNTISPNKTDSNSNEYFITDIPISTEIVTIKERKQLVDVSTNTTIDIEKVDISTSPLAFEELEVLHNKSTHLATSPTLHVKDSSINNLIALNDVNTEDLCDNNANKIELTHTTVRSLSSTCELEISSKTQEKTCLELNSSKNLCNENSNDCEIEMILKSMRLTDKIITPIPKTPINLNDKSSSKQSPVKQLSVLSTKHKVCPEAMILREENKALQTSIADLSKEIMNIKCILKNQFLMPEKSKKQVCENKDKSILNSEPFDDSNQRPLFINFDSEQSSDHIDNEEMSVTPELPVSFSTQENVIDSVQNYTHTRKDKASQVDKSKETLNKEETLVVTNISSDGKEVRPFLDSRKTIEKNLRHEDDEICTKEKEYVVLNDNKDKKVKCKKLSRLETFRKKLLPKNKIKKINVPIRKLRSKARPIHIKTSKNTDTEILLNNKPAYEKALKIMTELKLKKNTDKKESSMTTKVKKLVTDSEKVEQKDVKNNSVNLRRKSKEGNLNDNISTIEQPSVGLSELKCQNNEEKQQRDNNILTTSPKKTEGRLFNTDSPTRSLINTRSRSKINQDSIIDVDINNTKCRSVVPMSEESQETFKECNKSEARRRLKRLASDNPIIDSKRILRSKNMTEKSINRTNVNETILTMDNNLDTPDKQTHKQQSLNEVNKNIHKLNQAFDECSEQSEVNNPKTDIEQINTDVNSSPISHPKESILCKMIEKFGKVKIKFSAQKIPGNSLIKKYYGKKEQLEQTEILLLAAKEECKQVCIDYKDSLEKCTQLEKDVQLLQNENKDLQSNCCIAQNQVEAIKSHAHQLQVLVKEHETVIEALKIEKQLDKNFVKDNDKTLLNLQKENETLLKDLCLLRDIVLGKSKYKKSYLYVVNGQFFWLLLKFQNQAKKASASDATLMMFFYFGKIYISVDAFVKKFSD